MKIMGLIIASILAYLIGIPWPFIAILVLVEVTGFDPKIKSKVPKRDRVN